MNEREAERIVTEYGALLERAEEYGCAMPISLLPHSKKKLKKAFHKWLSVETRKEVRDWLFAGYMALGSFVNDKEANDAFKAWKNIKKLRLLAEKEKGADNKYSKQLVEEISIHMKVLRKTGEEDRQLRNELQALYPDETKDWEKVTKRTERFLNRFMSDAEIKKKRREDEQKLKKNDVWLKYEELDQAKVDGSIEKYYKSTLPETWELIDNFGKSQFGGLVKKFPHLEENFSYKKAKGFEDLLGDLVGLGYCVRLAERLVNNVVLPDLQDKEGLRKRLGDGVAKSIPETGTPYVDNVSVDAAQCIQIICDDTAKALFKELQATDWHAAGFAEETENAIARSTITGYYIGLGEELVYREG